MTAATDKMTSAFWWLGLIILGIANVFPGISILAQSRLAASAWPLAVGVLAVVGGIIVKVSSSVVRSQS